MRLTRNNTCIRKWGVSMNIRLSQNRWFGQKPEDIYLPDSRRVHIAEMAGDKYPVMTKKDIRKRLNSPYKSKTIGEMARGCRSACIVFDDMSRGTPCQETAHILLEMLLEGGIPKDHILFLCATGMHAPLELDDFAKKLGWDIVAEYPVYNHNPYENLVLAGTTRRKTRVFINAEFMQYDLKIGIGGMVPHPMAGFGGGSKIILPGLAGIDTVTENHKIWCEKDPSDTGVSYMDSLGDLRNCDMREDAEEAAKLAGLDFKIDILMNSRCEVVGLFAGDPVAEYYAAAEMAYEVYRIEHFEKVEVCIANANAKANEAAMAVSAALDCTKPGGDIVLINFSPTGCVNHYLFGMWGLHTNARLCGGAAGKLPNGIRQLIVYNPYKQFNAAILYAEAEQVKWARTWEEVLQFIGCGTEPRTAAVIKEAQISMFSDNFKKEYMPFKQN